MKKIGMVMVFITTSVLLTVFGGCASESKDKSSDSVPVIGIELSVTSTSITINSEIILTAVISPANATNKEIIWTSSDTKIATVSALGVVNGLKAGKAIITATTKDGNKVATAEIIVTGIKLNLLTQWNGNVFINYKEYGKDWQKNIQMNRSTEVQKDGNTLWEYSAKTEKPLEFYFSNEKNEIIDLGKIIMSNKGDGYAESPENFKTSYSEVWIKNGIIYTYNPNIDLKPIDEIVMLTINLHTYQETAATQDEKFNKIVNAILDLDADIITFQECAQNKNSEVVEEDHFGKKIRKDNMAKIITDRLMDKGKKYNYYWEWSHYGWAVWEEGSAVVTKYEISKYDTKYVSTSVSTGNPNSRKPVMVEIDIPSVGKTAVFSAHMGWWDSTEEPFKVHFENLNKWVDDVQLKDSLENIFIGGDFNIEAGRDAYKYVMATDRYIDSYYAANPNGLMDPTIGGTIAGWEKGDPSGKRIDYIFIGKNNKFEVKLAQRIFTENTYGRVSDHNGQYVRFKVLK